MNENEPDDRLSKDAPAHVAALLKSAAADEATDAELAELDRRMSLQLAAAPAPPSGGVGAGWVGGGAAAVLITTAAVLWALGGTTAAPPPAPLPASAPPVAVVPPAAPPPVAEVEHPSEPPPAKKPRPAAPREEQVPLAPAPPEVDELTLLEQAQAALSSGDSAGALDRVAEHERLFADGSLAQEREVLAIEALLGRGEREQAEQRAAKFLERYSSSVHRTKVRALLKR